jgi:hypothetical protein
MSLVNLLIAASLVAEASPTLILEKVRPVDDPRGYDLRDPVAGDRGVPRSCSLSNKTTVTLAASGEDASIEVERNGTKKTIVVKNVRGLARPTLACGDFDDFYYANPRRGDVYAYSANRLFQGEDPVVWTHVVDPFKGMDDVQGVMTDASVATVVQARQKLVLVEWFFRKEGGTGFWHEVFDGSTGAPLGKIGPSDLLMKTNEKDPWWILFQGGGNETANYVPQNLYRLSYRPPAGDARPAAETIRALSTAPSPSRLKAITKLSPNPVINHMIALLTPTRTTSSAKIDFCPVVPAQRARYWLGEEYQGEIGEVARNALLAFFAERQGEDTSINPVDAWFQAEIAPKEPMRTVLAHFNPQDDSWVAQYQQALLSLGGAELERLYTKYGLATGAVVRTKE